jgi:hypothetical protein
MKGFCISGVQHSFGIHIVHSPTNVLFIKLGKVKIYTRIHTNVAPTCFSLRPSSESLYCACQLLDDGRRPKHVGAIFV